MKTCSVLRIPYSVDAATSTRNTEYGIRNTPHASRAGCTILELTISIGIFAMVLMAIYATWLAILRGSQAGLKAAAEAQRARIALRTLEAAFNSTEMFVANMNYYLFIADTSGDMAAVSMAARVPDDFLGANQFKMLDQKVRRLTFFTEPGRDGMAELKMTIAPILVDTNQSFQPYTLTLARDVTQFQLFFYDLQKNEWLDEWKYTNRLPRCVQFALGLGKSGGDPHKPYEVVTSLVTLPSVAVQPDVQGGGPVRPPGPGAPGFPGAPGGGTINKNLGNTGGKGF